MNIQFKLADFGEVLASRATGEAIRGQLERRIRAAAPEDVFEVDFQGIIAISPSCADELFGRLYAEVAEGTLGGRPVVLVNLSDDHEEMLLPVLSRRGVFALARRDKTVTILGAPGFLDETFDAAAGLREFRASEIAQRLGLSLPAANNRLAKLIRTGALRRKPAAAGHGGREYVYRVSA